MAQLYIYDANRINDAHPDLGNFLCDNFGFKAQFLGDNLVYTKCAEKIEWEPMLQRYFEGRGINPRGILPKVISELQRKCWIDTWKIVDY